MRSGHGSGVSMLAKRVIPCLDVAGGRVVKGVNFVGLRDAGDPIELAELYDAQKADEVVFLDITATSDKRATAQELASRASASLHQIGRASCRERVLPPV